MGQRIGAYELEGELGRGGFARVYRARHVPTGAWRALKVLDGFPDLETVERFRREAESLAKVGGRGVVRVHESGKEQGRFFIALELMPGGSLEDLVRSRGRLEPGEAARLVAKLARALERCHAIGLVHRDVKPANVLFDEEGEPRLADFGCVRDLGASSLTQTGSVLGTPAFMSLEQLRGETVGPAADVFALGAILHYLVAGAHPHEGRGLLQIAQAVQGRRRRSLAELRAPAALEAIVHACVSPDARGRPAAGALAEQLEGFAGARKLSKEAKEVAPRLRAGLALVLALGVLVGAGLALANLGGAREPPPSVAAPEPPARPLPPSPPPEKPPPHRVPAPSEEIAAFASGLFDHADRDAVPLEEIEGRARVLSGKLEALAASDPALLASAIAPLVSAGWSLARLNQQTQSFEIEAGSFAFRAEIPRRRACIADALGVSARQARGSLPALLHFAALLDGRFELTPSEAREEARALAVSEPLHAAAYLLAVAEGTANARGELGSGEPGTREILALCDEALAAVDRCSPLAPDGRSLAAPADPDCWWAAWVAATALKVRGRAGENLAVQGADGVGPLEAAVRDLERARPYYAATHDASGVVQNQGAVLRQILVLARALGAAGRKEDMEAALRREEALVLERPDRDGIYRAEVARLRGKRAEALELARAWVKDKDTEVAGAALAVVAIASDRPAERAEALAKFQAMRGTGRAIGFNPGQVEALAR